MKLTIKMLEIDINNQALLLSYLEQDLIERQRIWQALQYSLSEGDILPRMVSRVIWQTHNDVARTWIDEVAGEEFHRLSQPRGHESYDKVKEGLVNQVILDVSYSVIQILSISPTLSQRLTSRAGLMFTDAPTLSSSDQDRIIASGLLLPYHVWIALLKLMATHHELQEFISAPHTRIDYLGEKLILENAQAKIGYSPIQVPSVAGGARYDKEGSWLIVNSDGGININLSGGIQHAIEFDASMLSHFSGYITAPEMEQKVRNLIHEKYGSIVWKNRFGKKGNGKKEEDVPMMERKPVWQV